MQRIRGLDALRFVLAVVVVLSHFGTPPTGGRLTSILNAGFNGVAAVMGFFVISGFCIHFPFRKGGPDNLPGYFLRRYLRIGLPMLAAMAVARLSGVSISPFEESVLWSLYAEIIYYTIYPALMWIRARVGWGGVIGGAFAGAFSVVASDPSVLPYHGYGPFLTWIVGLPAWLLGCRMADGMEEPRPAPSFGRLWGLRFAVWFVGAVTLYLRYHSPIGAPLSLTFFAPPAAFWIRTEIDHFRHVEPAAWLESAGAWSYSLYLMHMPVKAVYFAAGIDAAKSPLGWCMIVATTFAVSYGFYRLVERPAHLLARGAEQKLKATLGAGLVDHREVLPAAGDSAGV